MHKLYSGIRIRMVLNTWLKKNGKGFRERLGQKLMSYLIT